MVDSPKVALAQNNVTLGQAHQLDVLAQGLLHQRKLGLSHEHMAGGTQQRSRRLPTSGLASSPENRLPRNAVHNHSAARRMPADAHPPTAAAVAQFLEQVELVAEIIEVDGHRPHP